MNASFVNELTAAGSSRYGRVVFGDAMYQHWIELDKSGKVTSSQLARIGGGWSKFVDHETSTFNDDATHPRTYEYALRSVGVRPRRRGEDVHRSRQGARDLRRPELLPLRTAG